MPLHRSTGSQGTNIVLPMDHPEAVFCPLMNEPSFNTAVGMPQSNMSKPAWEAFLSSEAASAPGTVAQTKGKDAPENPRKNIEDRPEETRIGGEVKAPVKQLVTDELATLVEELLEDILLT